MNEEQNKVDDQIEQIKMSENTLIEEFEKTGVLANGHFQLRSGRHSDKYVNKDIIPTIPSLAYKVFSELCASVSSDQFPKFDLIVAPAVAGIVMAASMALQLQIPFAYAEKDIDKFKFRKTFLNVIFGKRVLVIEDVITTGGSVEKVIWATTKAGGEVVAVQCIWNRTSITDIRKVPVYNLIKSDVISWRQQDCPLCQNKIPTTLLR